MWLRKITIFSQKYLFELRNNVRFIRHKPWVPKFRIIRQMQPWDSPVDLNEDKVSPDESSSDFQRRLRRNGMLPPLLFHDRPINIGHTGSILDPYTPPDGDGRKSLLSSKKFTQLKDGLLDKGRNYKDTMLIRSYEPSFKPKLFAAKAESIYVEAHDLLQNHRQNESRLFELVTEKALVDMTADLKLRTLQWRFKGNIELPRVVHIRCTEFMSKGNYFAQVTVRLYTQQILAIYNRFGRLLYGNPDVAVDVLEYAVFEKHVSDEYGIWRLHGKVQSPSSTPHYTYIPTQRLISSVPSPKSEPNNLLLENNNLDNSSAASSPSQETPN
ncbi:unnamed protein product [Heterobilharzia americana]|nr:unnamed protein product [Heterobilharzia americana]